MCVLNIGIKNSISCLMNIIIFTIIKSINIKNIIFCVIIINKIISKLENKLFLILKNTHIFDLKVKLKITNTITIIITITITIIIIIIIIINNF